MVQHALKQLVPLEQMPQWEHFKQAVLQAKINCDQTVILNAAGLSIDLSAQRNSDQLSKASAELLDARQLPALRKALFDGEAINSTECRAAWHTMLRQPQPLPEVQNERLRVLELVRRIDNDRRWRNIVHIGIGGSDWGVRLATQAFGYAGSWRHIRFVSNIDGHAIEGGLAGLDPHDTLVVVATKSFRTAETMENAARAREWFNSAGVNAGNNMIAVTANPEAAEAWGIPKHNIYRFWDWVGGRFSLWSAVGVAAGLTVGSNVLAGLHSGAHAIDRHFLNAPYEENAPIQLALAEVANRSVLGYASRNLAVYDSRLSYLIPYLQQLEMESLGKSVDHLGRAIKVPTGPVVWGMPGTDAQHTFFQWLHQSNEGAPVDFIVCKEADHQWQNHHKQLLAHCLAQRQALLHGKSVEKAERENLDKGMAQEKAQLLAKHRQQPGGRPSNLIVLPKLSPFFLGALLALYEHKVFVEAVIWGLNPFDQWGVELGKVLADNIYATLNGATKQESDLDRSTSYWIDQFKS
ncbi:MAG: glucose-6-phosphate isomerase [Alcaligenaceae bacterium]|jgi:glucose-6-phosphate isomerase|nr:glucose-6-phosphate isomerase [Alcaligenaceae bacterium]